MELPRPVGVTLDEPVSAYWRRRLEAHTGDTYAGLGLSKFPEDLRVYEHLLWHSRADTVIEVGAQYGASALWFRDRLACFAGYRGGDRVHVISIDVDVAFARDAVAAADPLAQENGQLTFLESDVRDPELPARVARLVRDGARCLVNEDGAHTFDTTRAALDGLSAFVPPGGYFVVEDGVVDVDQLRVDESWPRGVLPAVDAWLSSPAGAGFSVARELELYGVTCHPGGFLRRDSS